jgi:hypothetical protein
MDGGLDLISHVVVAYPHNSITRLPTQVQQANDIPASQIGLNPGYEGSIEANVANLRFLQKALTSRIDSPDSHCKISVGAGFTAAVNTMKGSHISFFTLSPCQTGRKDYGAELPRRKSPDKFRMGTVSKWILERREND